MKVLPIEGSNPGVHRTAGLGQAGRNVSLTTIEAYSDQRLQLTMGMAQQRAC
jgi:hypothetical protein